MVYTETRKSGNMLNIDYIVVMEGEDVTKPYENPKNIVFLADGVAFSWDDAPRLWLLNDKNEWLERMLNVHHYTTPKDLEETPRPLKESVKDLISQAHTLTDKETGLTIRPILASIYSPSLVKPVYLDKQLLIHVSGTLSKGFIAHLIEHS